MDDVSFWLNDFGSFDEKIITQSFAVKPHPSTRPGNYSLGVGYDILYYYEMNNTEERLVGFRNVTLILERPFDIVPPEMSMLQRLKENQWLFLLIFGAIAAGCSLASLLFHPDVKRSALVGVGVYGQQEPVILIEPYDRKKFGKGKEKKRLISELLELGMSHEVTKEIKHILIYDQAFPVDVRHNTKIQRHKLVDFARKRVK